MPVRYTHKLSTGGKRRLNFNIFHILPIWNGSVYQAIMVDFIVFSVSYTIVTLIYRLWVMKDTERKDHYTQLIKYVTKMQKQTPLNFMLGFFITTMVNRWMEICFSLPRFGNLAFIVQTYVPTLPIPKDDSLEGLDKDLRRSLLRYLNLAWFLQMVGISEQMKHRFPLFKKKKNNYYGTLRARLEQLNEDEMVRKTFGKLVSQEEITTFERISKVNQENDLNARPRFWVPLQWAVRLVRRGVESGLIEKDSNNVEELIATLGSYRTDLGNMKLQAETSIPLMYIQVVSIAVYSYFICEVFTAQDITVLEPKDFPDPMGIPIRSTFKFIFYMGWFKVAIALLNPLGMDPQDFEMGRIFTDNLEYSYLCGLLADDYLYPPALDMNLAQSIAAKAEKEAKNMGRKLVDPEMTIAEHQIRRAAGVVNHKQMDQGISRDKGSDSTETDSTQAPSISSSGKRKTLKNKEMTAELDV